MKVLHNFLRIVDGHTIVVIVLALISTYICVLLDFSANMPTGLIGIAVVFPIVFSINAAYRRREEAPALFRFPQIPRFGPVPGPPGLGSGQ